jgi:hypothetical protein
VERRLRRFRERREQHEPRHPRIDPARANRWGPGHEGREIGRAGDLVDEQRAGQQRDAAAPCDDQRLNGRGPRLRTLVLEADEQERGEACELPEHEHRQKAVAEHHAQHRAHEREQHREKAARPGLPVEVARSVEDDECPDARDQDREQQAEAVEIEVERQAERRRPGEAGDTWTTAVDVMQRRRERNRQRRRPQRQEAGSAGPFRHQPGRDECEHERRENQGRHALHVLMARGHRE